MGMSDALFARIEPIQTMRDGTVKQVNPFSGTGVDRAGPGQPPLVHTGG